MTQIVNNAFCGSKLRTLKVENCMVIEEKAFADEYNNEKHNGDLNLDNVENYTKVKIVVSDE